MDYDLTGEEPALRSQALPGDGGRHRRAAPRRLILKALDELAVETMVLRAPRGLLNEPSRRLRAGLPGRLGGETARPDGIAAEIPDVNHYTIIMGAAGAAAVADTVREALAVA